MKKLYRYTLDCGRTGAVVGLFVADDETEIKPALGLLLSFGEIVGKHADLLVMFVETDLKVLTDDPSFIARFEEYGCASGRNPLRYIQCPMCSNELTAPYTRCHACSWHNADTSP